MTDCPDCPRPALRHDIEEAATVILALAALRADALVASDFDFIEANPRRAGEVLEFVRWLAV